MGRIDNAGMRWVLKIFLHNRPLVNTIRVGKPATGPLLFLKKLIEQFATRKSSTQIFSEIYLNVGPRMTEVSRLEAVCILPS